MDVGDTSMSILSVVECWNIFIIIKSIGNPISDPDIGVMNVATSEGQSVVTFKYPPSFIDLIMLAGFLLWNVL